LFSEKCCYRKGSGTSYECTGSTVVDVASVEGLATSVVSVRVSLPILVVVEVGTDSLGLAHPERLDFLKDRPSDTFGARW